MADSDMKARVAEVFARHAKLLELAGANPFKARTYENAARVVRQLEGDLGRSLVAYGLGTLARHHGSYGVLARSWPTGSMVIWVAVMLGLSLTLYYI